jgi:hypothetical protein
LKNRWQDHIRKHVHTHMGKITALATDLKQGRKGLPVSQLFLN